MQIHWIYGHLLSSHSFLYVDNLWEYDGNWFSQTTMQHHKSVEGFYVNIETLHSVINPYKICVL